MARDRRIPDARGIPRLRIAAAWLALLWERLWPALWPAVAILGVFLSLALLGLLPRLPGWLHLFVLGAFVGVFAAALWHGFRRWSLPNRGEVLRRLERDSALAHRPLEALCDRLGAGDDPVGRFLWSIHRRRMAAVAARLHVGWPKPGLIRRDRIALRVALAVGLAIALVAAGGDGPERLARALVPDVAIAVGERPVAVDAWITPPAYTGVPPLFLAGREATRPVGEASVPKGSVLAIRVSGGTGRSVVERNGVVSALDPLEKDSFGIDLVLDEAAEIVLRQDGARLAAWQVQVVPDRAPTIAFLQVPVATRRASLRIDFDARDDYGLVDIGAELRRPGVAKGQGIRLELPLPRADRRRAAATSFHDLTSHPWAGLPVDIELVARDATGQVGRSGRLRITLPERVFRHPVARAIVAARKTITADPAGNRDAVVERLREIAGAGSEYDDDVVVFLALTVAARRLAQAEVKTVLAEIQTLLWDTALRVEDGKLSLAERALRAAEQALREALGEDVGDDELRRRLDDLQAALDAYMDELARRFRDREPETRRSGELDDRVLLLEREDLQRLLDQIRALTESGARDAARRLLQQLQALLEAMRTDGLAGLGERGRQAMQLLDELQEMIQDEQELLDRTFREAERRRRPDALRPGSRRAMPAPGEPSRRTEGDTRTDAEAQERLRRRLGDLMRRLGEAAGTIPRPLGRAERAMREATRALRAGRPDRAVDSQTHAVDQLREGARVATEQLMQRLGQGLGAGSLPGALGDRRDPLGRRVGEGRGGFNTSDVEIPDESSLQRARRIRNELRRRAADRFRPRLEKDYIERLLRQF